MLEEFGPRPVLDLLALRRPHCSIYGILSYLKNLGEYVHLILEIGSRSIVFGEYFPTGVAG